MECPYCGSDSRVLDSRGGNEQVRRRRECLECGRRFTTYERLAPPEIRVAKRSGVTEPFDREKLVQVIERVTRDRGVTEKAREDLARGLEAELVDAGMQVVTSGQVADRLLIRLRELDALAAQRFATNYTQEDGSIKTAVDEPSPQLGLFDAAAADPDPPPPPPAPVASRRKKR